MQCESGAFGGMLAQRNQNGFGRDPTFNVRSLLYMGAKESDYYNTSAGSPDVGIYGFPYGFFRRDAPGYTPGYPVVIQV